MYDFILVLTVYIETELVWLIYFLRLPPTLEDEYVRIDVFYTNPIGQRQSGVRPNPVHHCPELCQKGN